MSCQYRLQECDLLSPSEAKQIRNVSLGIACYMQLKSSVTKHVPAWSEAGKDSLQSPAVMVVPSFQLAIYAAAAVCQLVFKVPIVSFPHVKSLFMERPGLRTKDSVILLVCHDFSTLYELLTWDFKNSAVLCSLWV